MKLRNKKTGEIVHLNGSIWRENNPGFLLDSYDSLKAFLEEYEDVPEKVKTWEDSVKIRELPSGLRIADRNYYELDKNGKKKTEFSWNEAMARFENDPNWRLPTPKELNQMVLDLGYNDEGVFDGELFVKNLGKDSLEAFEKYPEAGYYWSSTPYAYTYSLSFYFNSSNIVPQTSSNKTNGFTVRCVAR